MGPVAAIKCSIARSVCLLASRVQQFTAGRGARCEVTFGGHGQYVDVGDVVLKRDPADGQRRSLHVTYSVSSHGNYARAIMDSGMACGTYRAGGGVRSAEVRLMCSASPRE